MTSDKFLKFLKKLYILNIILICAIFSSNCQINPAKGEKEISLLSKSEEKKIGRSEHKKIISQFGGEYKNKKLQNYVNSLGNFLVSTSELPNDEFKFTILDTPIVNAFALPGGYIYLTRGLIALCHNEAQLAGVIAHEIGHVTARHTAQRYTRAVGTNIVANILNVLTNNMALKNLIGQSANLFMLSYSSDQEYEADSLAVRYMARAGFETREMANFLQSMEKYSNLTTKINRIPSRKNNSDLLSTHPSSSKRVRKVIEESDLPTSSRPIIGRDIFLKKIDGLLFGDSPNQGVIFKNTFVHKDLKIMFSLDKNFYFINKPKHLIGYSSDEGRILIDVDNQNTDLDLIAYSKKLLGKNFPIEYRKIKVNGMDALDFEFFIKPPTKNRLVIIEKDDAFYRFLYSNDKKTYEKYNFSFQKIFNSFKRISSQKILNTKNVLRIIDNKDGKSIREIALNSSLQERYSSDLIEVLNSIKEQDFSKDQKIKNVTTNY